MQFNYWKKYLVNYQKGYFSFNSKDVFSEVNLFKNNTELKLLAPNSINKNVNCAYLKCACRYNPFIWISEKFKMIYYEIPKSASTTIKSIFKLNIGSDSDKYNSLRHWAKKHDVSLSVNSNFFFHRLELLNLKRAANRKIEKKTEFDFVPFYGSMKELFNFGENYFKFTFIREPRERFLSNYAMFTQQKHRIEIFKSMFGIDPNLISFDEFLNFSTQMQNHHWNEQINFIPKLGDKLFVDFIGSVANFNPDIEHILERKRIQLEQPIVAQNKTKRNKETNFFNDNNLIIFNTIYKNDLELYKKVKSD